MQINTRTRRPALTTHEGAPAKRVGPIPNLRRSVMATMLYEDTFYESGETIASRIAAGVAAVPLEVASQIAIEAREQMYLRHAPLLIVREMARRGGRITGDTLARVIQRADELTEFVAMCFASGMTKKGLTAQIKRGLAEAFTKFDAYQIAKYDRERDVRLRDVLFLCHAKPKDEAQAAMWKQLVDGTLLSPDTWEVGLSGGADKLETWTRLLTERKLGGLALLRNLRNMKQANVPESLIREAIADNKFSKVLPFRFISAAKYAPQLEDALEDAMLRAATTLEKLPGRTVVLIDSSGSMGGVVSSKSEITRFDAAAGVMMILREICDDVAAYGFSSECFRIPARRGFALRDAVKMRVRMEATYLGKALRFVDADYGKYDRIIVITDEQSHDTVPDPKGCGYIVNVAPYQNGVGYGAWLRADGWSENIVRYIQAMEAADQEVQ